VYKENLPFIERTCLSDSVYHRGESTAALLTAALERALGAFRN